MGYGTNGLTFNTLRGANTARLPQFKNKHGELAHSKPDGSDWSPAQWLQAVFGELGEWAQERVAYENGEQTFLEFKERGTKEVADVQTYVDIWARRSLDRLTSWGENVLGHNDPQTVEGGCPFEDSPAQSLMRLIADLGAYANARKKYERGDYTIDQFMEQQVKYLSAAEWQLKQLRIESSSTQRPHVGDCVEKPHPGGVDLGLATMEKFNEVSDRVGSNIYIDAEDWHYLKAAKPEAERRK